MKELITALRLFFVLSVITGIVYPLVVTGIAQAAFPSQANGSLITQDGKIRGSSLVGQPFEGPEYFWSRPSATGPFPYNAGASSGSNLGPTNPALVGGIDGEGKPVNGALRDRVEALRQADPSNTAKVPTELVTASGSGLDPHISVAAAEFQVARVAANRNLSPEKVRELVNAATSTRQFGILGEPVVNVLQLNLVLDRLPGNGE